MLLAKRNKKVEESCNLARAVSFPTNLSLGNHRKPPLTFLSIWKLRIIITLVHI